MPADATPLSSSIHGHDVLAMMIASDANYTPASLLRAIEEKFGSHARFHTCSADNMSAAQLIGFLADRGKFVARGNGFTVNVGNICSHGAPDHAHE